MARIISVQEEIELGLRLLEKEYDPFQMDLEWFKYELSIKAKGAGQTRPAEAGPGMSTVVERHAARGKINRKDFSALLSGLDDLIFRGQDLRYEPYDLNFYLEWKLETPRVYSIVTWFDMALSPRALNSRFPSAHLGFRFLTDEDSLGAFRSDLEMEFIASAPIGSDDARALIN